MESDKLEPIAIVGINLKFPSDAVSPDSFWKMLYAGRSVSGKVPAERFNVDAFYHPDPARLDAFRVSNAHFLKEDPRAFDAPFFSISPAEAAVLDPQQRCLLEGAYHTFENAGIPMHALAGSNTSVYSASFGRDAEVFICRDSEFQSSYQATSSGASMLSNRLSYFYDLRGPSLTVDTACSSGLIAFHLACQSLWSGDAEQSLVCGSNTYLTPESMNVLDNAGFLSPDGHCHSFDHQANGYARGEGFGFVLLKPLTTALQDGNVIRAVVRATGVNQDGRTPSITAPSMTAQMDLIRKTYEAGGIDLETTEYVEAHGTGTIVGDPIEAGAIGRVFSEHRDRPLHIGSVKANIGHLEGASGLAGLLKTILALEQGIIPPIAGLEKVNPAIDIEGLRLQFNSSPVAWPPGSVRRASVSSFGYGGSNAHVVLEDAYNYLRLRNLTGIHKTHPVPQLSIAQTANVHACTNGHANESSHEQSNGLYDDISNGFYDDISNGLNDGYGNGHILTNGHHDTRRTSRRQFLVVLSASDEDGPRRQAAALETYLGSLTPETKTDSYYADLVHTLNRHRTVLGWRACGVIDPLKEPGLVGSLSRINFSIPSKTPLLHFVFSGQGAQTPGMGLDLLRYPVFERSLQDCNAYFQSLGCNWLVLDELRKSAGDTQIHKPALSQPLCTCIQIALVELLQSWNVTPASVCGHSSGEIAAAFCAGALTRESAWKVSYHRGLIAENLAYGHEAMGMMSVGLGEKEILAWLDEKDSPTVGCVNSPINVTLTGSEQSIDRLWKRLERAEIFARKLDVSIAYHSKAMKAGSSAYLAAIQDIESPPFQVGKTASILPVVTMYSSITGDAVTLLELADPAYWVKNLVSPVRFADALSAMLTVSDKRTSHFFAEISPKMALRRPIQDTVESVLGKDNFQYASTLRDKSSHAESMLELLGHLWTCGFNVDIGLANAAESTTPPKLLTDLPAYPFSRSKEYWRESRLSRNVSFRPFRRHALLGLRAQDWNATEASWRNIIRVQENPWILDHGLNGSSIYPGSGMLVMAIEAARQLSVNFQDQITGYSLKDVHFLQAIVVDESDHGSEAAIYMRPRKQVTNNTGQIWRDWRIFRVSGDQWSECAYGSIRVEVEPEGLPGLTEAANVRAERFAKSTRAVHQDSVSKCSLGVFHEQFYKNLSAKSGFDYGPHFALLRELSYDKAGHASARLNLKDYAASMPYAEEDPCVIHPSTLDAIGHLHVVALSKGGWQAIPTQMFSHVKDMWISHKLLSLPGNPAMYLSTNETFRGFREAEFSTRALLAESLEPVVVADGLRTTAITSLTLSIGSVGDGTDRMCYGIQYQPYFSLMTSVQIQEYLRRYFAADARYAPASKTDIDRGDAMSWHFMTITAKKLEELRPRQYKDHLERYVIWLRTVVQEGDSWSLESRGLQGKMTIEQILGEANVPLHVLTKAVGEKLYEILTDQIPPLQIIFGGTLADDFYHSDIFTGSYRKIGTYIQILAHANPNIKILECGAGTGSATAQIIPSLVYDAGNGNEGIHFAEYAFTDVSPGFFETARERFQNVEKSMRFQKLDFDAEPVSQGFEAGGYDVVVAANCLHATADIVRALENVHSLLKPGGKLILVETTNVEIVSHGFIFGLVPGWWLRRGEWWENDKKMDQGPLLTEEQWARVLPMAGFSGLDMIFRDYEVMPYHRISVLVTTAASKEQEQNIPQLSGAPCAIVIDKGSDTQWEIANQLKEKYLYQAAIFGLAEVKDRLRTYATVVCLVELDRPVLITIDEENFAAVKHIALNARRTLWVSDGSRPYGEIARGLGRAVNSERGEESFATLTLEQPSDQMAESIEAIHRVLNGLLTSADSRNETEYVEEDGLVKLARVSPIAHLNEAIRLRTSQKDLVTWSIGQEPKPRFRLTIDTPGLLETLYYQEDATHSDLLGDTVEVEVKAAGLNLKDVGIALGQIAGEGFGLEGSGIVTRVGPQSVMRPGDRVMFYTTNGSGLGTFQTLPEVQTLKIPDNMALTVAAVLPAVYGTAVYSIDYVACLIQGESILIHEGAGSNGQSAVQLAKLRGAEIFTTVDNEADRQLIKDLYGLPDSHILFSRHNAFAQDIRLATRGRGVDVVFNTLGGELLQESWDCIAPCGRFINLAKVDILANSHLPMGRFDKNVTFAAVDLSVLICETPQVMKAIMHDVISLFEKYQHLHEPKPLHILPASQLENGMRSLQGGKTTGKFVVDFDTAGDKIEYRPALRPSYFLDENATYVVTGGFGGLGREIVRWMASRGARHFVLLSRRGANNADALDFVRDIEESGAEVYAPACDVGDRRAVESVLQHVTAKMPPIKGCIHGAMVLKDDLLVNMTAESFHYALGPKVGGSWNFHELLPTDIDFFLLLSSFAGIIGDAGQSNYAAGNTFEDALARYRASIGLKAVAIDLSLIAEAGWANENFENLGQSIRGHKGLPLEQLMTLLDVLCDPSYDCQKAGAAQVIPLQDSPEALYRMGEEGVLTWMSKPLFSGLHRMGGASQGSATAGEKDGNQTIDYLALVHAAAGPVEAAEAIAQGLVQKLARSLSVPAENLDIARPAHALGVDSLIAVQIRYWILKQLQVEVPVFLILEDQSLSELCETIAAQVLGMVSE